MMKHPFKQWFLPQEPSQYHLHPYMKVICNVKVI